MREPTIFCLKDGLAWSLLKKSAEDGFTHRFWHVYSLLKSAQAYRIHCNENPIYVFPIWESCGLSPNFHIHVSVSYLYISRIDPHISCSRIGRSIVEIYKSLTGTWLWNWYCGRAIPFLGIFVSNFRYWFFAVYKPPSENLRIRVIFVLHLALLPYCIKVESMVLVFSYNFNTIR